MNTSNDIPKYFCIFFVTPDRVMKMATESFFEDMVIDTKEAADNLNELVESGVTWKRGNSVLKFASADDEIARKLVEKHSKKK